MRVLITGAATGIGAATAQTFRSRGAEVTAVDIAHVPHATHWIEADLSTIAGAKRAAEQTTGPFNTVILAAGIPPRADNAGPVLAVNFIGLRAFATAIFPKVSEGGSVVTVASRAGAEWRENIDQVRRLMDLSGGDEAAFAEAEGIAPLRAYFLSKEAVVAWSMAQTARLAQRGIRINSVSPAAVDTPILSEFMDAFGERAVRALELAGRAGTTAEIAEVIHFLTRPESAWIRGQDITPDGGVSAMVTAEKLGLS